MSRKTVAIKNIDTDLLSQQKNDLIDVIGFLEDSGACLNCETSLKDHLEPHTKTWIESLDGLLNMIDDMQDSGVGEKD